MDEAVDPPCRAILKVANVIKLIVRLFRIRLFAVALLDARVRGWFVVAMRLLMLLHVTGEVLAVLLLLRVIGASGTIGGSLAQLGTIIIRRKFMPSPVSAAAAPWLVAASLFTVPTPSPGEIVLP